MNITVKRSPNKSSGKNAMREIVIHWWDEPHKKPSMNGVVSWLTNPASQVSAHYVVSDRAVVQLLNEDEIGWHARQANTFTIGIEVDPNTPGDTYKTVGRLVREIRARRGNLPLKRHSDYVATGCPGSIDTARIERESKQEEDEMLNNRNHLIVLFRRFYDRDPSTAEINKYLGKVTYGQMIHTLDGSPERHKLTRLIVNATKDGAASILEKIRNLVK